MFSLEEETQIPDLRDFVHKSTNLRRKIGLKRLVQNLGQFVFDLESYIMDGGTQVIVLSTYKSMDYARTKLP